MLRTSTSRKRSTNEAHALNETAAIVFDLCDGTTSRATMVAEVARRTGLPADESIVELALTELADAARCARVRAVDAAAAPHPAAPHTPAGVLRASDSTAAPHSLSRTAGRSA